MDPGSPPSLNQLSYHIMYAKIIEMVIKYCRLQKKNTIRGLKYLCKQTHYLNSFPSPWEQETKFKWSHIPFIFFKKILLNYLRQWQVCVMKVLDAVLLRTYSSGMSQNICISLHEFIPWKWPVTLKVKRNIKSIFLII